ncbi:MAG: pyridoxal phosphate-dependent aminotransferase [Planctomycetota bacterium]|nr:pyridoxal phosphate-dependent aminotransferase [Planctomycetota bacterium]
MERLEVPAGSALGAFREIPYMGVIWVVAEAMKLGFWNGHPDWCNLGQGQPEVGEMEGAPPRIRSIAIEPGDQAYGPVNGNDALREAVAAHYNRLYRQGKASQYTAANVSIACGGRLMLARIFAALGEGNLGYMVPDYTAYEDMIDYHRHRITPVLLVAPEENGFTITPEMLAHEVAVGSLDSIVLSNPCNPTGNLVRGEELEGWVRIGRERSVTLILDEFYSHFVYDGERPGGGPVSAAAYVEDVERDPVILVDGLTKCFRYPGWRLGWAVGPSRMIETLGRAASAIDGGPSQPLQRAALEVLEPARADQEATALRNVFSRKRNLMVSRLADLGIRCPRPSEGTFYAWASIADLPPPLNEGHGFFRAGLERRVMTVPGVFFDVNPGKLRVGPSPYEGWVRFSFGPPEEVVRTGLERLEEIIRSAS